MDNSKATNITQHTQKDDNEGEQNKTTLNEGTEEKPSNAIDQEQGQAAATNVDGQKDTSDSRNNVVQEDNGTVKREVENASSIEQKQTEKGDNSSVTEGTVDDGARTTDKNIGGFFW